MLLRASNRLLLAFMCLWAFSCVISYSYASLPIVFEFSYFVLPFSAFIVPLCMAQLTCRLTGLTRSTQSGARFNFWLTMITAATGVAAYILSFSVIGRFLELPWRSGKFGETSLSLGKSAAEFFSISAFIVMLSALAVLCATPRGSRHALYAAGSLGMIVPTGLAYFLFGISSFVQWRA